MPFFNALADAIDNAGPRQNRAAVAKPAPAKRAPLKTKPKAVPDPAFEAAKRAAMARSAAHLKQK